MRIALGQEAQVLADGLAEIEPGTILDERGGAGLKQFDGEHAELVLEAGSPGELDGIAGLEHGSETSGSPSTDKTEMPAATGDHGLGDDTGLAMATDAYEQGFTGPFHACA